MLHIGDIFVKDSVEVGFWFVLHDKSPGTNHWAAH